MEKAAPGSAYGHIVEVPGFGKVSLAKLSVDRAFHLTMLHVDASASSGGIISGPIAMGNGHGSPGGQDDPDGSGGDPWNPGAPRS